MKIAMFQFSLFGINTYVVYDDVLKEAAVIDPGMMNQDEEQVIMDFIHKNNLTVVAILNTHLHLDHAIGNKFMKEQTGSPIMASELDNKLGKMMGAQAIMFGIAKNIANVVTDKYLNPGDLIKIGKGGLLVLGVPGHSKGSLAFYDKEDGFVIVGDALFKGSIGRTDLPGGDFKTLISSIREQLLVLPPDTVVYSGHGSPTTIGEEGKTNPFLI